MHDKCIGFFLASSDTYLGFASRSKTPGDIASMRKHIVIAKRFATNYVAFARDFGVHIVDVRLHFNTIIRMVESLGKFESDDPYVLSERTMRDYEECAELYVETPNRATKVAYNAIERYPDELPAKMKPERGLMISGKTTRTTRPCEGSSSMIMKHRRNRFELEQECRRFQQLPCRLHHQQH